MRDLDHAQNLVDARDPVQVRPVPPVILASRLTPVDLDDA